MFYSIVIKLKPAENFFVPIYTGHFTYAFFLSIVNKANPNLAKKLYNPNEIKPFTLSGLIGKFIKKERSLYASKENEYYIRITILDSSLFSSIISILLDNNFKEINIGKNKFIIKKVIINHQENQLTSFETIDGLWSSSSTDDDRIILKFMSPTFFKLGGDNYLFPEPNKVFGSIERKFLVFAHGFIGKEIEKEENIFNKIKVSRINNLSTNIVQLKNGKQIGFKGEIYYDLKIKDKPIIKYINVLANFAKYSGVGAKTTLGFGQTIKGNLTNEN
ncbi:MAG: CRISPR-associated endoribonuclease Cas6 [Endomicrobiaceae bacterium]|jgi:CRISPR-associated endoribonuclease Cas6|nr:CRISPR-associated endoribonuclease Cas6 [Endomicrobiaceae bacterium]MDD3923040.1 CRISPR-associated endoribonuclease Cas6 [Endomicrobiaceae bacterium]